MQFKCEHIDCIIGLRLTRDELCLKAFKPTTTHSSYYAIENAWKP